LDTTSAITTNLKEQSNNELKMSCQQQKLPLPQDFALESRMFTKDVLKLHEKQEQWQTFYVSNSY